MKFCYVDESGTGDEPYAVMVGIIVDAHRMRTTKTEWDILLASFSEKAKKPIDEIHTKDLYRGRNHWRGVDGSIRHEIVGDIITWFSSRKHPIVCCALEKEKFVKEFAAHEYRTDVKTIWRFLGLHLALSIQKMHQRIDRNKGNTVFIFDHEDQEQSHFTDLLLAPPQWTESYYSREKKQEALDQIVDVPHFADSKLVPLLQVADVIAYFLRLHTELENGSTPGFEGERAIVAAWAKQLLALSVDKSFVYPKRKRCACADTFFSYAPACLRD
jgi:hypothetical protein